MHQIGDGPIHEKYREMMMALARGIDGIVNNGRQGTDREVGFVLLVFPFGDHDGRCNYISNGADRRDIVTMMKEQIRRFEGQPELQGHA